MCIKTISNPDLNFDKETFENDNPVMVFFGAKRCNVCQEMFPLVEEISVQFSDRLTVYFIDVDQYKSLFKRFRLRGIPTFLIFKNGEVQLKMGGMKSREELARHINEILEK